MPEKHIEVRGLKELERGFKKFPKVFQRASKKTLGSSLLVLQEKVPAYPPAQPGWRRTGTLGRSLGVSEGGGTLGKADVQEVHGFKKATFGTNVVYARRVIGDRSTEQGEAWRHWWTLGQTVVDRAKPKILRLFKIMTEELAKFLDRSGR